MRICLVTPAPAGSRKGNRVTAERWARLLRELGHRVAVVEDYAGQACDVLVALHARRNAAAVARFRAERPAAPLVLALTGTDLYRDIRTDASAQRSLALASRLVVLQPLGIAELPRRDRAKARVIFQSATPAAGPPRPREDAFEVSVLSHLREVKDPLRTALAARRLPAESRIRVLHCGSPLVGALAAQARRETATNGRYRWLGEVPRWRALRVLARSRLLVLTSILEGGANVVSEAIAAGVPVVSSRIPGSIGLLGEDYPGYFPTGDEAALADVLSRAERDAPFYRELRKRCVRLQPLVAPPRERRAWARLLAEVAAQGRSAARARLAAS